MWTVCHDNHCVRSVCIQNFSGPYFSAFGLPENADQKNFEYEHFPQWVFSFQRVILENRFLWCIKNWPRLLMYLRQLPVFPNNFVRTCPIKLNRDILYHVNNTFRNTFFLDICFFNCFYMMGSLLVNGLMSMLCCDI